MSSGRDRAWLLASLPHQGAMNLLESVVGWDEAAITARATNHREGGHPLRRDGMLPATAGIEYGAQAAAAHGALVTGRRSGPGFLVSVRGIVLHVRRLDDVTDDLDVVAERLGGDDAGVLYRFDVASSGRVLVEGRVAVAFPR